MNHADYLRDVQERCWTIVADTNEGRRYLNLYDPPFRKFGWSPWDYLGLRFRERQARQIADALNRLHEAGNGPILPEGALHAEAIDTTPKPT